MIFLGLLWVTAWIGSILSLSQNLPPSVTSNILPTKGLANVRNLGVQDNLSFEQHQQQFNVRNATLIPISFLKNPSKQQESRLNLVKPSNYLLTDAHDSKSQFCRSLPYISIQQPVVNTPSIFVFPTISALVSPIQNFLSNKILHSLQNFFFVSNFAQQNLNSTSSPVVVVHRDEDNYEVWVNEHLIANLLNKRQASSLQQSLTKLLKSHNLDPSQLKPAIIDGTPALMSGNRFLFGINQEVSQKIHCSGDLLAIQLTNNLRTALQVPALPLVEAQQRMYGLTPTREKIFGFASWYGSYFQGRLTANGEIFNKNELTVAHRSLPFNTYLQVTNLKTQQAVIVRVNDRGPYIPPRSLDLSQIAARCINSEVAGVVPYEAVIMKPINPTITFRHSTITIDNHKIHRKLAVVAEF